MRSALKKWVSSHWRSVFVALSLGCTIASLVGVFESLAELAWSVTQKTRELLRWPTSNYVLLTVAAVCTLVLFGKSFSRRLYASWKNRLINDAFLVWAICTTVSAVEFARSSNVIAGLAVAAAFICTAVLVWRDATSQKPETTSRSVDPDLPITTVSEDSLHRSSTVNTILAIITREQPSVVALTAPYGDGKSSVLNLVEERLKQEFADSVTTVRFSSWLPPDTESLVLTLFESITAELRSKFVLFRASEKTLGYVRVLTGSVPYLQAFKDLFRDNSQQARIERLTRFIKRLPTHIVLLIDDIDRMGAEELFVLLKIMRGVADFSNITFVCAYDHDAVVREIKAVKPHHDIAAYLRKFFPIQIPLPKIEPDALRQLYIDELTSIAVASQFVKETNSTLNDRLEAIWKTGAASYITNLRRLKLFLNKVKSLAPQLAGEVDFADFVTLEIVRDLSPETYDFVYANGHEFYESAWAVELWQHRTTDDNEAAKKRAAFFDSHFNNRRKKETIIKLLGHVFPTVYEYSEPNGLMGFYRGSQQQAEEAMLARHPRFFRQYFTFRVPSDYLGQQEFESFVTAIHGTSDPASAKKTFKKEFASKLDGEVKRWKFIQRVDRLLDRLTDYQAKGVALGMAEMSEHVHPESFEWRSAVAIVGNGAYRTMEPTDFLVDAIRQSTSDLFAAELGNYPDKDHAERYPTIDQSRVRDAFSKRMSKRYVNSDSPDSIFALGYNDGNRLLFFWNELCGPNEIANYLKIEFTLRPESAIKMLQWMLPSETLPENPGAFAQFYQPSEFLAILEELDRNGKLDQSDQERLSRLRKLSGTDTASATAGNP